MGFFFLVFFLFHYFVMEYSKACNLNLKFKKQNKINTIHNICNTIVILLLFMICLCACVSRLASQTLYPLSLKRGGGEGLIYDLCVCMVHLKLVHTQCT